MGEYINDPEHLQTYISLAQTAPKLLLEGKTPRLVDEAALSMSARGALKQSFNYIDAVAGTDISQVDGVRRDKEFTLRLMRSYARFQGAQAPLASIYQDLRSNAESTMTEDTISSYVSALKKLFVIEDSPAWNPNLRSRTAIRTSDTRYYVDSSIATAALGVGPGDLIMDLKTMGLLFETMCVRDLRVYAEALDGKIYHFRDKNNLECDAVMHLRSGKFGLIEVKLGGENLINEGVKTLHVEVRRLADGGYRGQKLIDEVKRKLGIEFSVVLRQDESPKKFFRRSYTMDCGTLLFLA